MKRILIKLVLLTSLLITLVACEENNNNWWQIYFTKPGQANSEIPNALVGLINKANSSIHIAAFEFNLDPVAEALIQAHKRGVEVQWVTDNKHGLEADKKPGHGQFTKLKKAGIKVKDDARNGLMHNKFIIIDGKTLWTGSTNLTTNGTQKNNNNVIVISSPALATIYEQEFQEMWQGKFGKTSPSKLDNQQITVNNTPIQVMFGAEDNVAQRLTELISQAQRDIKFMAFAFTEDAMGKAMLERAKAKVKVQGIFEVRGSETKYSELTPMFCAGLPVRQDGNPRTFHHKVIIIDNKTVVTGSFNFSQNANKSNDENVLIISNPQIAARYVAEFNRRWEEAKQPSKTKIKCKKAKGKKKKSKK